MSHPGSTSTEIGAAVTRAGKFLRVPMELFHSGTVNDALREQPCRYLRFE